METLDAALEFAEETAGEPVLPKKTP